MSFKEQRRFPRVSVRQGLVEVIGILGARVTWPNLETSEILDISYKGVAARRPGMFPVAVHEQAEVEIQLGMLAPFKVMARIAWCNMDAVGLELKALPADGHLAMTEYLEAKLEGASLKPVERSFVSRGESFQHWFQGPGGLHVLIWTNKADSSITRVVVELNGKPVEFERGKLAGVLDSDKRRALLVLSQMDKPGLPMEDFVRSLGAGVQS